MTKSKALFPQNTNPEYLDMLLKKTYKKEDITDKIKNRLLDQLNLLG